MLIGDKDDILITETSTNDESIKGRIELLEQEVRQLRAKEMAINGLSDAIKTNNRVIKIIWILLFVGGLGASFFFIYRVFEEYRNEPTATKAAIVRTEYYSFPPIVLCIDTWLNMKKAAEMGLSNESVEYALNYLIPFEDANEKRLPARSDPLSMNYSDYTARQDFIKIYHQYNFTSLLEFYKYISLDATIANQKNSSIIQVVCRYCQLDSSRKELEKLVLDKSVCYVIQLHETKRRLRQSYGLPEVRITVPDYSNGINKRKPYWRLFVDPNLDMMAPGTTYVSIYDQKSQTLKISHQQFHMINKPNRPCLDRREDGSKFSSFRCAMTCVSYNHKAMRGCQILNLVENTSLPLDTFCNTYYWRHWPLVRHNKTSILSGLRRYLECLTSCPDECTMNIYTTSVDAHISNELVKEANELNYNYDRDNANVTPYYRNARIFFINAAAFADGYITFTEVFTYSFETLVGNIGGTCGIWIGASIMTLIQLILFMVQCSLRKMSEKRAKKKKQCEQIALV